MTEPELYYIGADEELRELLSEQLSGYNLQLETFSYLGKLMTALHSNWPEVVLVDEKFEGRDSLAMVRLINQMADEQNTSIFWHPLKPTRSKIIQAAKEGVDHVLTRPMNIPSLVNRVKEVTDIPVFEPDPDERKEDLFEHSKEADEIKNVLNGLDLLDAVPHVVETVLQLTRDKESNIQKLADVISSDPHVTAVILKRANSAYYASREEITRIREAIARIGFREVRATVVSLSVIKMFPEEEKNVGFDRLEFWKACLLSAVISKQLANEIPDVDPGTAFVAGAIHDIGRIIFDEHFTEPFREGLTIAAQERIELLEAEKRMFGMDHQEVGAYILQKWDFPEMLRRIVGCHEVLEEISSEFEETKSCRMSQLVWFSSWLTRMLPYGSSGEQLVQYQNLSELDYIPLKRVRSQEFFQNIYEEVRDLLLVVGKSLDYSTEKHRKIEQEKTMYLYEETDEEITPPEILLIHAGFQYNTLSSLEELEELTVEDVGICEFESIHSMKDSLKSRSLSEVPLIILLPRGEVPKDDQVKKRAGMPVENTEYLQKPIHLNDYWDAMKNIS